MSQKEEEYLWGHDRPFNAYSNYIRQKFGQRIQKLSLDAGFTCPNRDGSKSRGGCTYCNNNAFNPGYCLPSKSINQQLNEGIEFHRSRYKNAGIYFAYFQAYSNTYASLKTLKEIYQPALEHPMVKGIIIGTRPDCIDEEKLDFFSELNEKYFVGIEYGIESCYNSTLEVINRGHSFEESKMAIEATAQRGIHTTGHLIIGLPGESRQQIINEAEMISDLPLSGLKLHQLQLVKGTQMAQDFQKNPGAFYFYKLDEYIDLIIEFLAKLNPEILIERLAGESQPDYNLTPEQWNLRYDQVLQRLENRMRELGMFQGKEYKKTGRQTLE